MSEFLMVVPETWVELPWTDELYYAEDVLRALSTGDIESLNMYLIAADAMPPGKRATSGKLFQTEGAYRFWVLYEDI